MLGGCLVVYVMMIKGCVGGMFGCLCDDNQGLFWGDVWLFV